MKRLLLIGHSLIFLHLSLSFSDAQEILFHGFEENALWIYSVTEDAKVLKKVVKNGLYPLWAPDGNKFAYLSQAGKDKTGQDNKFVVSIADIEGKVSQSIAPLKATVSGVEIYDLPSFYQWSPDSKTIAIVSFLFERVAHVRVYDFGTKKIEEIYKTKVKDFDLAYLCSSVHWINKSKLLFFDGSPEREDEMVKIIDLKTKEARVIIHKGFAEFWDGKGILTFAISEKGTDVCLLDENGKMQEKILTSPQILVPATKIRNNKIILFGGKAGDSERKLYLLDLARHQLDMVDLMTPQKVISLEFSPDANKFVCVLVNEKENKGGYYIYNIVSKQFIRLRELEIFDRSYLMSLILGQRRPYSWK